MMAQCAHSLGTVHARCGKYDDARHWYKELLRKKREILGNIDNKGGKGAVEDNDNDAASGTTPSSVILR